jgi:hypothetical protein
MGVDKATQALEVREPSTLEGWKFAIAMGAAIILAPVIGLVLLFVAATLIPVLPLLAAFLVRCWWPGQDSTGPSTPVRPPQVFRPRMSHASAP